MSRRLIEKLISKKPMTMRDLVGELKIGRSTIYYHLKNIPKKSRTVGRKTEYWIGDRDD